MSRSALPRGTAAASRQVSGTTRSGGGGYIAGARVGVRGGRQRLLGRLAATRCLRRAPAPARAPRPAPPRRASPPARRPLRSAPSPAAPRHLSPIPPSATARAVASARLKTEQDARAVATNTGSQASLSSDRGRQPSRALNPTAARAGRRDLDCVFEDVAAAQHLLELLRLRERRRRARARSRDVDPQPLDPRLPAPASQRGDWRAPCGMARGHGGIRSPGPGGAASLPRADALPKHAQRTKRRQHLARGQQGTLRRGCPKPATGTMVSASRAELRWWSGAGQTRKGVAGQATFIRQSSSCTRSATA